MGPTSSSALVMAPSSVGNANKTLMYVYLTPQLVFVVVVGWWLTLLSSMSGQIIILGVLLLFLGGGGGGRLKTKGEHFRVRIEDCDCSFLLEPRKS